MRNRPERPGVAQVDAALAQPNSQDSSSSDVRFQGVLPPVGLRQPRACD